RKARDAALLRRCRLVGHALAVVLKIRLRALRERQVLVALRRDRHELVDVVCERALVGMRVSLTRGAAVPASRAGAGGGRSVVIGGVAALRGLCLGGIGLRGL